MNDKAVYYISASDVCIQESSFVSKQGAVAQSVITVCAA
jgi:hypothetical protein